MKFCPECGTDLNGEFKFCPECGEDLDYSSSDNATDSAENDPESRRGTDIADGISPRGDGKVSTSPEAVSDDQGGPEHSTGASTGGLVTRRRAIIGGGVVLAGAGAGLLFHDSSPKHSVYGDAWDTNRNVGEQSASVSGSVELPPGRYASRDLRPSMGTQFQIDFSVEDGKTIDIFVVDDGEYDRYRDREGSFQFYQQLSATGREGGTLTGTLGRCQG